MRRGIENGEPGVFSSAANAVDFQNLIISTSGGHARFHHMYRKGNIPIEYYFEKELTEAQCHKQGYEYIGYIEEGTRFAKNGIRYQHFDDLKYPDKLAGAGDGLPLQYAR